ncbi:hypothetical protein NDI54_19095 [Haloarcula sp. S1AR25-5A]|uniref:Uncharacterized protein n=1 Tax=Haloarcula terrestris TaxID=2950533 RepID=A0AAE4F009_9EURY|nr:hypothetical protein [Haloarcula terrestris]MDS0223450.1 hypothetical protein [Haloarcula terrestris]
MNDEFVTEAIANDRCLKAKRLLDRFESELHAELSRVGTEMQAAQPELFESDAPANIKYHWDSGTILANVRDNLPMTRINPETGNQLKLNISVRWVDPTDWGENTDVGALCAACYKINHDHADDFEVVKEKTLAGDWEVNFGTDQFNNAAGIIYIPVTDGTELRAATDNLIDHFEQFGTYWGVEPDTDD